MEDKKDNKNKSEDEDTKAKINGISFDYNAMKTAVARVSAVDSLGLQFKAAAAVAKFSGLGIDPNIVARVSAVDSLGLKFKVAAAVAKFSGLGIDPNIVARISAVDSLGLQFKAVAAKFSGLGIDPNIVARVSAVDSLGLQFKAVAAKFSGLGIDPNIVARVSAVDSIGLQFKAAARFKEININDIEVNVDGTINYNNENIDVNKVISNAIIEMNNCLNEETLFNRFLSNIIKIKNPLIVFVICFYIILPLLNNINNISLPSLINTSDTKIARKFISQNINSSKKYAKTIQKKHRQFLTEHPNLRTLEMFLIFEPIKKLYTDYVKKRLEMKLGEFLFIFKKKSNKKEINNFKKESIKSLREELNNKTLQQIFLDECRFVNSDNMEIRDNCLLESKIIGKIELGQTVKILYKNNHWSLVEFSKNNEIIKGWIATHHLCRFD